MHNVFQQFKRSFAVLSALFITVVTSKLRGYQSCGPQHLLDCAKPLSVLTDSGLTLATSKSELDNMCPNLRNAVRCVHGYSRHCMRMKEREHFKTLFHGTVLVVEDLCRNQTYQEEYLKYTPCMKQVETENEICLKTYTNTMKDIESRTQLESTVDPDLITYQKRKREVADEGIRSVCCAFQEFVECSTSTIREACGNGAAQFSKEFLDKMSFSLIQNHCREYGTKECGLVSEAGGKLPKISSLVLSLLGVLAYYVL